MCSVWLWQSSTSLLNDCFRTADTNDICCYFKVCAICLWRKGRDWESKIESSSSLRKCCVLPPRGEPDKSKATMASLIWDVASPIQKMHAHQEERQEVFDVAKATARRGHLEAQTSHLNRDVGQWSSMCLTCTGLCSHLTTSQENHTRMPQLNLIHTNLR